MDVPFREFRLVLLFYEVYPESQLAMGAFLSKRLEVSHFYGFLVESLPMGGEVPVFDVHLGVSDHGVFAILFRLPDLTVNYGRARQSDREFKALVELGHSVDFFAETVLLFSEGEVAGAEDLEIVRLGVSAALDIGPVEDV